MGSKPYMQGFGFESTANRFLCRSLPLILRAFCTLMGSRPVFALGRCHKQMEWAPFRPLLGSILDKSRPFGHFLGPPWGAGQTSPGLSATLWVILGGGANKSRSFRPLLWPILGGGENKSRPFRHFLGLSWGAGQTSPGPSATSWPFLGGGQTSPGLSATSKGGQTSPGLSATSWALLGGGANKSRPSGHFLGLTLGSGQTSPQACRPLRGAAQTSPGLSATSWALLGPFLGGGANKSRPFSHFLGPSWGWGKQVLAIVGLFGLVCPAPPEVAERPFSHFLGPSWGAGQTSPGHSLTSWAHLGGRGKQVQAILSLLGPILGGRGKKVQAILSLLHLGGRGKQVQAILSLLGPILGGRANKSRPFSHFLGPSWGRGKQVQAILSLLHLGGRGNKSRLFSHFLQAILSLLGPILGGGANKSRPFSHFLGPSWGAGQTSPATLWVILGGGANKSRPFGHFFGPSWGAGKTSPGLSATSWAYLGGRGKQVQAFRPLLGPFLGGGQTSPGLSATSKGGANKSRPFGHFMGPFGGCPDVPATSWAHLGGRGKQVHRPVGHFGGRRKQVQAFRPLLGPFLGPFWGVGQTSPGLLGVGQTSPRHSRAVWTCLPRPPKWPTGLGLVHPNPPKTHPKPITNPLETLAWRTHFTPALSRIFRHLPIPFAYCTAQPHPCKTHL